MGSREYLADQKSFYVAISRARDAATLVTDNPADLAERLARETGEKISALESYLAAFKQDRDEATRENAHPDDKDKERADSDTAKSRDQDDKTPEKTPQKTTDEPDQAQLTFDKELERFRDFVDQKTREERIR